MARVGILGPGGVGGFLAAALQRAGEGVVVVAREPTAEIIARRGIEVQSTRLGSFTAAPRALTRLTEPVGALIVATKAAGLEEGLERIEAEPDLVVPLLNGLDHMGILRSRFGSPRVAAGTIRIESDRPAPGRIVQTSPDVRVDLAAEEAGLRPRLEQLALMLSRAGVPARLATGEAEILWGKLVRLNALALTTSAADRPIGFIRSDPRWRRALLACIAEGAAVARAEGAAIDPAAPLAELEDAHAELGSSMRRDIAAGREPELDAIAGAVLRAARRHGIACPVTCCLSSQVAERAGIEPPRVS